MEVLIYPIPVILITYFLYIYFQKQQDIKTAKQLIKFVDWQYTNRLEDISYIEYLAFKELISYIRITRNKNAVNILNKLIEKKDISSDVKNIISKNINILYELNNKLGSPFDNVLDLNSYYKKAELYLSSTNQFQWQSQKEKKNYVDYWNFLSKEGTILYI